MTAQLLIEAPLSKTDKIIGKKTGNLCFSPYVFYMSDVISAYRAKTRDPEDADEYIEVIKLVTTQGEDIIKYTDKVWAEITNYFESVEDSERAIRDAAILEVNKISNEK